MTKAAVTRIVNEFILPVFPGSTIKIDDTYSIVTYLVGQPLGAGPRYLAIQGERNAEKKRRVIIYRPQPFKGIEIKLLKEIMLDVIKYNNNKQDYYLYEENIFNRAVARSLSPKCEKIMQEIFGFYEYLTSRTYEGRGIAFSCIINLTKKGDEELRINRFFSSDFFMVLTNSINTIIEIDTIGRIIDYTKNKFSSNSGRYPIVFQDIAEATDSKIGLSLTINGDILIFHNKELIYAKRRGKWQLFSHDSIHKQMACGSSSTWKPEIRNAIYETAIDVSFMHTGGLIGISTLDNDSDIKELTYPKYILEECIDDATCEKKEFFKKIIRQKFHEIDRYLRKEICSIDGAVLLKHDGTIIAIGAIIKSPAASDEGARTAAAITISKIGLAIKISTDGVIKGFSKSEANFEPLFIFG